MGGDLHFFVFETRFLEEPVPIFVVLLLEFLEQPLLQKRRSPLVQWQLALGVHAEAFVVDECLESHVKLLVTAAIIRVVRILGQEREKLEARRELILSRD